MPFTILNESVKCPPKTNPNKHFASTAEVQETQVQQAVSRRSIPVVRRFISYAHDQ
jgi:hypothetical protein